jgi:hypothetical protein
VVPNGVPFVVAFLACLVGRGVAAPLNPESTAREFSFYLADAGAKARVHVCMCVCVYVCVWVGGCMHLHKSSKYMDECGLRRVCVSLDALTSWLTSLSLLRWPL